MRGLTGVKGVREMRWLREVRWVKGLEEEGEGYLRFQVSYVRFLDPHRN